MNVRCQSCDTVYRIDPLKVPVEGVDARCTVCSAIIPIERITEDEAPATDRPMTPHAPTTEDRVKHALGDAFIPAPAEDDSGARVEARSDTDESDMDADFPEEDLTPEQREAERTSERQAVQSMPGIIMPPIDDDLYDAEEQREAPAAGPSERPLPEAGALDEALDIDTTQRRVSRPFVPPSDLPFAKPTPDRPAQPVRPTAPVFRPTPGRPAQIPTSAPPTPTAHPPVSAPTPAPARPFRPSASPPASPQPAQPRPAGAQPPGAPRSRPINPFLSRDPGQKARRLARALISDMIVYQPEKRQKALENGTLAEAFDEEIKKSWEEYVDQVGEELANSTTYFNDALNELLADGEKMF